MCFCSVEEETVPRLMLLAELQRKLPPLTAASLRRSIEICGGYTEKKEGKVGLICGSGAKQLIISTLMVFDLVIKREYM